MFFRVWAAGRRMETSQRVSSKLFVHTAVELRDELEDVSAKNAHQVVPSKKPHARVLNARNWEQSPSLLCVLYTIPTVATHIVCSFALVRVYVAGACKTVIAEPTAAVESIEGPNCLSQIIHSTRRAIH